MGTQNGCHYRQVVAIRKWSLAQIWKLNYCSFAQNSYLILVTEARRIRENVRKQANYLSHRRSDLDDFSLRVEKQLSDLKSRIKMARNAAESIKISITNQRQGHPDSNPMGCSRSYRVNLTSSTTNEIRCQFHHYCLWYDCFNKMYCFIIEDICKMV